MAKQQRGRLLPEDEKRVRLNFDLINTDLDGKDLVDRMFQDGVFSIDDMEEVQNAMPNIRKKRIEVFLSKLFNSGPNGYKVFVKAVREAGYNHVADTLDKTVLVEEEKSDNWFEDVEASRKLGKVQEKELSRMVSGLGNGWEFVAQELDISQVQIEQAKMSQTTSYLQMFAVFVKWRQRKAGKATFQAFVHALKKCNDDGRTTVDWDVIKHVVLNSQ